MTGIRTKYLWKRCVTCRETKVCREVPPLTPELEAILGRYGRDRLGFRFAIDVVHYLCGECDPEANAPEYAGVEHEVTFDHTGPIAELLRNPNEGADLRHSRGVDFPLAETDATGTP